MNSRTEIGKRQFVNVVALTLACAAAGLGLFWLIFILADVLRHGIAYITPGLFLNEAAPPGMAGGGLKHAFIGQLLITLFAVLIGIPLGILGGTWLAEYGRHHSIGRFISTLSDIMISVPSIVIGTFVYAIFVKPLGHFSGFAPPNNRRYIFRPCSEFMLLFATVYQRLHSSVSASD